MEELLKLKELAPYPMESLFLTGYLTCSIPLPLLHEVRSTIQQLMSMVQEKLINYFNVLEVLVILKCDVFGAVLSDPKKKLSQVLEEMLSELVLDNAFLNRKYF
jgi:hypothetical protein